MTGQREAPGLARQYAILLAVAFIAFELLMAAVVVQLLMLPMARRAAADLAGLMVLSAQTWSELPPQTRPAFEIELYRNHLLALRAEPPAIGQDPLHGPYVYFLERALAEKTGARHHLAAETIGGRTWYWAALPSGGGTISVGLPHDRVGTQPLSAMLIALSGGLALGLALAFWLARRAAEPLARFEAAAAQVGQGRVPELLPETGPRELAALARRFNAMARQVQELLAARTTLFAGVSHDLRTPLARMRVALALLEERPSPKVLAQLERDVEEMDRLIGDVLDLARGLNPEPGVEIALADVFDEIAGANCEALPHPSLGSGPPLRGVLRPSGLSAVVIRQPDIRLCAPPMALRRALGNLLDNALRHAGEAPVELVAERAGDDVRIGVLDRGPGIPDDRLETVFEPFVRLDAARSPAKGGAGLGLAIVRQLAQMNGWTVELKPREGGGLEAWLTLPAAGAASAQQT